MSPFTKQLYGNHKRRSTEIKLFTLLLLSFLCIQGDGPSEGRISSSASIGKLCLSFKYSYFVFVVLLLTELRLKRRTM